MSRFRTAFGCWFLILMASFLLANVAGLARPMGLKPFRAAGFPLTIAAWGAGMEQFFDWSALAMDMGVAVAVSVGVASVCAWARSWSFRRGE